MDAGVKNAGSKNLGKDSIFSRFSICIYKMLEIRFQTFLHYFVDILEFGNFFKRFWSI